MTGYIITICPAPRRSGQGVNNRNHGARSAGDDSTCAFVRACAWKFDCVGAGRRADERERRTELHQGVDLVCSPHLHPPPPQHALTHNNHVHTAALAAGTRGPAAAPLATSSPRPRSRPSTSRPAQSPRKAFSPSPAQFSRRPPSA